MGRSPDRLLDVNGRGRGGRPALRRRARRRGGVAGAQLRLDPAGLGHRNPQVPQMKPGQGDPCSRLQRLSGRLGVGAHQSAGSQERSAEVTGDDDGRVGQSRSPQDVEHGLAGRAGGLAVVVGALGGWGRSGQGVSVGEIGERQRRAVVARIGVGGAHVRNEAPGLVHGVRAAGACQEVGLLDLQVDLGLLAAGQGDEPGGWLLLRLLVRWCARGVRGHGRILARGGRGTDVTRLEALLDWKRSRRCRYGVPRSSFEGSSDPQGS